MADFDENRTVEPGSPQDQAEMKLAHWVRERYEFFRDTRTALQKTWTMVQDFYDGRQTALWHPMTQDIAMGAEVENREDMVVENIVRAMIDARHANLVQQDPIVSVVAASGDESDVRRAEISSLYLTHVDRAIKMRRKRSRCLKNVLMCGGCLYFVHWPNEFDYSGGLPIVDVISPRRFFPYPGIAEFEDVPEFMVVSLRSKEYIWEHYGVVPDEATDEDIENIQLSEIAERMTPEQLQGKVPFDDDFPRIKQKPHLVIDWWARPSQVHPMPDMKKLGRHIITAGNKLVHNAAVEYVSQVGDDVEGRIPAVWIGETVDDRNLIPTPLAAEVVRINMALNKVDTLIQRNIRKTANVKIRAEEGSVKELLEDAGEIWEYKQGSHPWDMPPVPGVPAVCLRHRQNLLTVAETISGMYEFTRAKQPAGSTTATQLLLLEEDRQQRFGALALEAEEGEAELARQKLAHAKQFLTIPTLLTQTSISRSAQAMSFFQGDIPKDYDIVVVRGSAIPQSKVAQNARLEEWLSRGIISLDQFMDNVPVGTLQTVDIDRQNDIANTYREHDMLKEGALVYPQIYDDGVVHLRMHLRWFKSAEFQMLPPNIRANAINHLMDTVASMSVPGPPDGGEPDETQSKSEDRGVPPKPESGQGGKSNGYGTGPGGAAGAARRAVLSQQRG